MRIGFLVYQIGTLITTGSLGAGFVGQTDRLIRIKSNYHFIVGFNSSLIALGMIGILTPSSSALLHNGSTIMTGVKSMTKLLDKRQN